MHICKLGMVLACALLAAQPVSAAQAGAASDFEDALVTCDAEALSDALSHGASANWVDPESGETALHYAVQCEAGTSGTQHDMVLALLNAGASVSAAGAHGESVLERAMLFGTEPTLALLLDSGADPRAGASWGVSMLAIALIAGNESAERVLIQHGAELLPSDPAAIEQWSGIGDFAQSIDAWMDRNPDAGGDEELEAYKRFLRLHLGHIPELASALDGIEPNPR